MTILGYATPAESGGFSETAQSLAFLRTPEGDSGVEGLAGLIRRTAPEFGIGETEPHLEKF